MASSALEILRQRMAMAQVSLETLEAARKIISDSMMLVGENAERYTDTLRKEWMSDVAVEKDRSILSRIRSDPDRAFLDWIAFRVENPYHVTPRAIAEITDLYGYENAMRARDIVWPQEIAWAKLYRVSTNDAYSWRAGVFLTAAMAKPREIFLGLVEHWFRRIAEDSAFGDIWQQSLKPELIWPARTEAPEDFVPTCILFTNEVNMPGIFAKPPEGIDLAVRAKKYRLSDAKDRLAAVGRRYARDLEAMRLYRDSSIARYAIGREFSSNEVILGYEEFIGHVRRGAVEVDGTTLQHAFLKFLGDATVFLDDPTEAEKSDRLYDILQIGSAWVSNLPPEIVDLGGRSRENLEKWKNLIIQGHRQAPIEPVFDYYFFLYKMNAAKINPSKNKKHASA